MVSSDLEQFSSAQFAVMNWAFTGIAFLFTAFRIAVRMKNLRTLYLEDYFAILAFLFMLTVAIINELMRIRVYQLLNAVAEMKSGKPLTGPPTIFTTDMVYLLKAQVVYFQFFWATLWCVKASLMVFYRRLFVGVAGYMKWWWIATGLCVVTFIGSCLTGWLACTPIQRRWSLDPKDACNPKAGIDAVWAASAFDIFSDLLVMILPLRLIWGIRVPLRQKFALGGVFSIALLVVVFAAIRMVKIVEAIQNSNPAVYVILALWSVTECFVAVVVGNLPTLKVLISRKNNTSYDASGYDARNKSAGVGTATTRSKISGPGTHIRLYDMGGDNGNDSRAAYGSDEQLQQKVKGNGITKTQEITITRDIEGASGSNNHDMTDHESLDSMRKYRGSSAN